MFLLLSSAAFENFIFCFTVLKHKRFMHGTSACVYYCILIYSILFRNVLIFSKKAQILRLYIKHPFNAGKRGEGF